MPLYEYVCVSCDHEFEELVLNKAAEDAVRCPACRSSEITRKLSVFAARQGASKPVDPPAVGPCGQCCNPDGTCPL